MFVQNCSIASPPTGAEMATITITYRGVELDVTGDYHAAGPDTWACPGDPAEFIVEDVYIGDQEVTHLLRADMAAIERAATEYAEANETELRRAAVREFSPC
jgi:hypothetical protein